MKLLNFKKIGYNISKYLKFIKSYYIIKFTNDEEVYLKYLSGITNVIMDKYFSKEYVEDCISLLISRYMTVLVNKREDIVQGIINRGFYYGSFSYLTGIQDINSDISVSKIKATEMMISEYGISIRKNNIGTYDIIVYINNNIDDSDYDIGEQCAIARNVNIDFKNKVCDSSKDINITFSNKKLSIHYIFISVFIMKFIVFNFDQYKEYKRRYIEKDTTWFGIIFNGQDDMYICKI